MNRRCLPEPPGVAVGSTPMLWGGGLASSTVGLRSAYRSGVSSARRSRFTSPCCSGTPVACPVGISAAWCPGTSTLSLDCSSMRVLRGGVCMFGGGATGFSSSSDHSSTAALRVRVVWSPPSERPPGLGGTATVVFLFFWAGSSTAPLFPQTFSVTEGELCVRPASVPPDSDEVLAASSVG